MLNRCGQIIRASLSARHNIYCCQTFQHAHFVFHDFLTAPPSLKIVRAETVISLIGFGNAVPTAASFGEEGRHVCCCYHRVYGRWPQRIGVHI